MAGDWGTEAWGTFPWGGFVLTTANLQPDSAIYFVDIYCRGGAHLRFANRDIAIYPAPNWKDQALSLGATACWMLNEASGTAILDAGASGITMTGGPNLVRQQPGPLASRWTDNFGTQFPGGSEVAASAAPGASLLNPRFNSFSIEVWFRIAQAPPGGQYYTFFYRSNSPVLVEMQMNSTEEIVFRYDNASGVQTLARTGSGNAGFTHDGLWHHLVAVRDVSQSKAFLYLDSDLIGSGTEATLSDLNLGTSTAYIGSDAGPSSTVDGDLFGVSWYDVALTPSQVQQNYYEGAQGPSVRRLATEFRPG